MDRGICNFGIGRGFSIREVIAEVEKVTGRKVAHRIGARRPGDPAVLISDAARATRELDWSARFTDLEQILETAWAWHQRMSAMTSIGNRQ